ncbi:MAG TPA: amino acid adenylation domain-containing protein [Nostocaceae cyanobacterium]|nr:amino acid adenylation domain-containing protein [Nostocaceae cyanobacterium]
MNLSELLAKLFREDVQLWVDENDSHQLRIRAPKGVITPELQQLITKQKSDIIALLRGNNAGVEIANLPSINICPEKRYQPFPLTDIQHAYWIGRSGILELGSVANHGYYEIECDNLDLDQLTWSLQQLIQRHDMLRAIILPDGQQQILEKVPDYQIAVLDLRGKDQETVTGEIENIRQRMSHQVLPTDKWPLFEFRVTYLDQERLRLHISYDLQIFDAWSLFRLFDEWYQLYQNPQHQFTPLELSFRDYVLAEKALHNTELYKHSHKYWCDRLETLPPPPDLPLAKKPKTLQNQHSQRYQARIKASEWQQLKQQAANHGLTPSGVLIAAFAEILTIWGQNPKFTLNLALFNRLPLHPQVNEILGDFTSITLLAVDNSTPESFSRRSIRLQQQIWRDLEHRYISGVEVVRELACRKGTIPSAMPVVFTSTIGFSSLGQETLTFSHFGELVYGISQASQAWMDVQVWEEKGELTFNWDVVDELFPEGLINEMFTAYCYFLQQLAASSTIWNETHRQIIPFNQAENFTTAPISEEMLHTLFYKQVENRKNDYAVIFSQRNLTYQELYELSNRVGHRLRALGTHPNQLVAVVMEKGWEQIAAVLGILAAGAAYVPIDPGLPPERRKYLLANSGVSIVLTQSWLNEKLAWSEEIVRICIDNQELGNESISALEPSQTPSDLAYLIYTSGSTGLPKGVKINHYGAVNTILDINRRFNVNCSDRILALSSLSFDLSVYDIFGTLAAGGTIVIPNATSDREPAHWVECISQHQVTIWNSVPALMQMLVDYASENPEFLASLRLTLLSGDWLPLTLPDQIKHLIPNIQVISLGGATEASIWSILYPISKVDPTWKSIPYGQPMTNQGFYVLNQLLEPCPVWVSGHLFISGIGLAEGYWNDEAKTAASFITHPVTRERLYKTGDLGRYLPDGNIEFLGREDYQVKIGGYRIELGEIEAILLQHPAVHQGVVTVVGEQPKHKRLIAYVVVNHEISSDELRCFLQKQLPEYMLPSVFIFLDNLPLSANGKVDRRALPNPTSSLPELKVAYVPPQNELEQTIANIWQAVLKLEKVGVNDKFFELGGNSLLLIEIYNQLQKQLPPEMCCLSIVDLFNYSTIRALSEYLSANQKSVSLKQKMNNLDLDQELRQGKNRLQQRYKKMQEAGGGK